MFFEKDSKLYFVYGEETKLLMDLDLIVGDKANEIPCRSVVL